MPRNLSRRAAIAYHVLRAWTGEQIEQPSNYGRGVGIACRFRREIINYKPEYST